MGSVQQRIIVVALIAAFVLLYLLQPILMPFLTGMLLAYMGDPFADWLEERGLTRRISVVLVFLSLSFMFVLFLLFLIPLLGKQLSLIQEFIPVAVHWLKSTAMPLLEQYTGVEENAFELDAIQKAITGHLSQAGSLAGAIIKEVGQSGMALIGAVINIGLIPVVTFYLLLDWDRLKLKVLSLFPRRYQAKTEALALECDEVLGSFIKGQLLVMLCLSVIYATGLWLVGLKLALLVGLVAGLASIVPYLGAIIGIGAGLLAGWFQFGDWLPLVWIALVFGVGQLLESFALTPLLVGDKIGLHPVTVIFAIMAGGQLAGFVGVLIALPVAAVVMVLLRHLHDYYKDNDEPNTAYLSGRPESDESMDTDQ
ncbi:AI-2E family transporter [Oceanospirillum linum]|uniref:AI-2E family transporter n=1 Tax=Oceanospirillum linum TaxID=966 RepID=A0A1T1HE14_OCELI|nr:AI-2E family transporter [Oceanospirillum linum]OOV88108.1 AI-2E family transporter [Oceanospirillum linum]SEF43404.1 Predicted PurR-regulated permease PerM [Oleiphilus messinensis]SMP01309.1 Predicted PurR-regulated permease PerM [Oceanospirillum linum]